MQIHLSPRHLKLTAAIHGYVAEKISHLEAITDDILAAHVVLIAEENKKKARTHCVKVHLAVPGKDIHAEDTDGDLYAAIDKVASKAARQLRKRKTRLATRRKVQQQKSSERRKQAG